MPIEYVSQETGKRGTFGLDIDLIIDYERTHPDWSLIRTLSNMGAGRLTDLDVLVRLLGYDGYKAWLDEGWTMADVSYVLQDAIVKDLGFPSSTSTSTQTDATPSQRRG